MKICVVQAKSVAGEIEDNIARHKKLIELAVSNGARVVMFPELSLTGYEPKLAKQLATDLSDSRFDDFQKMSDSHQVTIGVGMPIVGEAGILIGMILFQPHRARQGYFKQQLHSDELPYFIAGDREGFLDLGEHKIAPAICYESLLPAHSEKAARNGASIYLASVAKSARGVEKAFKHFPEVAKKHCLAVLMSNCVGPCNDFVGDGQTAAWTDQGILAGQLDNAAEGILVFDTSTKEILVKSI